MRKLIKNFRTKYKQAVAEIKDLTSEHIREKAELFETLQDYESENALFKEIASRIMAERELNKIL